MNWFIRKNKSLPDGFLFGVNGHLIVQENLPNPVFARGFMGQAWGIYPETGEIFAPFDGTVTMTFPTEHAIALQGKDGTELLIHIGIDTIKLNGQGYRRKVWEKERISKGQLLMRFDPKLAEKHKLDPTVVFVITRPGTTPVHLPHQEKTVRAMESMESQT